MLVSYHILYFTIMYYLKYMYVLSTVYRVNIVAVQLILTVHTPGPDIIREGIIKHGIAGKLVCSPATCG